MDHLGGSEVVFIYLCYSKNFTKLHEHGRIGFIGIGFSFGYGFVGKFLLDSAEISEYNNLEVVYPL